MDMYCSIGHYLKISYDQKTAARFVRSCPHHECQQHRPLTTKFCGNCGSEVQDTECSVTVSGNNPKDLLPAELLGVVYQHEFGDVSVWCLESIKYTRLGTSEAAAVIDPQAVACELQALESDEKINNIIRYMKAKYGDDSVALVYGAFLDTF
ncbi:MAG: hypothetical protein RSG77_14315 [Hafnia sp.]